MLFQVQLQIGTKTETQNIEANDYKDILELFSISSSEVLEIREYVYMSSLVVKDDGDYVKYLKINASNDMGFLSLRIPKIKNSLADSEIITLIKDNLELRGKSLSNLKIEYVF